MIDRTLLMDDRYLAAGRLVRVRIESPDLDEHRDADKPRLVSVCRCGHELDECWDCGWGVSRRAWSPDDGEGKRERKRRLAAEREDYRLDAALRASLPDPS